MSRAFSGRAGRHVARRLKVRRRATLVLAALLLVTLALTAGGRQHPAPGPTGTPSRGTRDSGVRAKRVSERAAARGTKKGGAARAAALLPGTGSLLLAAADFDLVGLAVTAGPETQSVPKNTPTVVLTGVRVPNGTDPAQLVADLNPNLRVRGELTGPSLTAPLGVEAQIGQPLAVPPLSNAGDHVIQNLRVVDVSAPGSGEQVVTSVTPDACVVNVIDRLLITQVQVNELSHEEILQAGIKVSDDSYTAFNFTLALATTSGTQSFSIPAAFPNISVPDPRPIMGEPRISAPGVDVPAVYPIMLTTGDDGGVGNGNNEAASGGAPLFNGGPMHIPALLVIPGNVGFLHQFFEAIVIVANGAPNGAPLVIKNLRAEARLPNAGTPADSTDDPLRIAETQTGGRVLELDLHGLGDDGKYGTPDDTDAFAPGQTAQASFLLEGLKEGMHTVVFDLKGSLEGLPTGPLNVRGEVPGAVLVRDVSFAATFTHPSVVRAGQEYDLALTLYNSGGRDIQGAFAQLSRNSINGAQLLAGDDGRRQFTGTIRRGEPATVKWRLRANATGAVTASYVKFGEEIGAGLNLVTGVGDRGVPLSPDSLILPEQVEKLPPPVVEAARELLGQAWSIANAPAGSRPAGVAPVRKRTVTGRAAELGVAGVRVDFGEPVGVSLHTLLRDWLGELQGGADPGFADAERNTPAGYKWFDSLGAQLHERLHAAPPATDIHREFADAEMGRSPFISALLTHAPGEGVAGARLVDVQGARVGFGASEGERFGDVQEGAVLRLSAPEASDGPSPTSGQMLVVSNPGTDQWTLELTGWRTGTADLSLVVPATSRTSSRLVWSGVQFEPGGKYRVNFRPSNTRTTPVLEKFRDGSYQPAGIDAALTTLNQPPPRVVGAMQVTPEVLDGGDKYGRLVGVLFSKPMLKETAGVAARYRIGGGALKNSPNERVGLPIKVTGATLNFGDRLVLLALDSPVGPYVERDVTMSGLSDARRLPLDPSPTTARIVPRVSPEGIPQGAYLTGRVLSADGTPVNRALVIYWTQECPNFALALPPPPPKPIATRYTDEQGRYEIDYVRSGDCAPLSVTATHPFTQSEKRLTSPVAYDGQHMSLDLVFLARGNVGGVVTSGGNAVANALVKVVPELDVVGTQVVQTDAAGRYEARNVPVGHVTVTAVGTGDFRNATGFAAGTIEGAGRTTTINVSMQDVAGTVRGRVVRADGSPSPGSLVIAYAAIPGFPTLTGATTVGFAYTDRDGTFVIKGLPVGNIRLEVTDYVNGLNVAQSVQLTQANREASDILITLPPGGASPGGGNVGGMVVNDIGLAVPDAVVSSAGRTVRADAQGNFTLLNLIAGQQNITAFDPATGIKGGASVLVQAGETTNGVTVVLTRPAQLQGTVFLVAEGATAPAPAAGVRVTVDGRTIVTTDEQGRYTLSNVTPNRRFTLRFVDTARSLAINAEVTLRPGDTLTRDATFRPGRISGKVFQPDGLLGTGADILLFTQRPRLEQGPDYGLLTTELPLTTQAATDGTYALHNINPGKYRVSASNAFFPVAVSVGGVLQPSGAEVCNLTLVSTLAGRIQGVVYKSDGISPAGAGIKVTLGGGLLADATVQTDENGHYEFAEVFSAGTYTLTALDPATGNSNRVYLSVEKNKDAFADVRLLGRGVLRVRVVDGAGVPATSGSVTLDGASFPAEHRFAEVTPASGGVVQFDELPEGPYGLSATQHGLGGRASATVPLNSIAEVTVQLQAAGTVEGRVFMPGGTTPVGLADVSLQLNGRTVGFAVTSDAAPEVGRFGFTDVPTGEFTLDVFDNRTGRVGRSAGRITAQGETATVNVELLPIGTVTGRVTANGNAVEHAVVRIDADGSGLRGASLSATTDPAGLYRFNGIPAGRFRVSVTNGPGGLTGSATGTVSGTFEPLPPAVVDIALEPSWTITGTVFKHGGTEPLPGARVQVRSTRGTFQTATREDGSYRLDFVPLGEVRVRAEAPTGFDRGETTDATETQAGATLNVNVTLDGTGVVVGDAFSHDGARLMSGRVTFTNDAWETPVIVNANVQSDGCYRIEGVPVGRFTLKLTVASVVGAGAASGDIIANQTVEVPVRLEDAGRVTGRVKTESGAAPVVGAGVILTLLRTDGQTVRFYSHTDAQGLWVFENIPLGAVRVGAYDAASPGVALVTGVTLNANGQTLDVGDVLLDNTPIRVVSVTPAPGAVNRPTNTPLTVTFSEAALPSSVYSESVQLFRGTERLSASVALSTDGLTATVTPSNRLGDGSSFALVVTTDVADLVGHPLPDEFRATFTTADETAPAVLNVTPAAGSFDVPVTTGVVATFGEALERHQDFSVVLKLTTDGGSVVEGTYTLDDAGRALAFRPAAALGESRRYNVAVTNQRDAAGNAQTAVAGVQFTTFNPPPTVVVTNPAEGAQLAENQTVELAADAADNTAVAQVVFNVNGATLPPVTNAPYVRSYVVPTGSTSLNVSATATDDLGKTTTSPERTVAVTNDPGATVAGVVTNPSGQVAAAAQVTMTASNGTFNTQTDAAGRYRFDNAGVGELFVNVFDPASNLRGRGAVSVGSFAQTLALDIRLFASGAVTGTVFGADGVTPLASARVSLTLQAGGAYAGAATTDEQGRYTIDYVPLGNFRLDVSDPATDDRGRASNQLNVNGETRTVNVTMNGLGRVVVTVQGSANQLVAGAPVSLTSLSTFGGTQTETTASDGTATFERVLAGNVYVGASDPATRLGGAATSSVAAGATANVVVRLEPAGTISGRVFDVEGATPVAGATVRLLDDNYYNSVARQATSGADGGFRFEYVPLGTYHLDALDSASRVRARSNGAVLTSNGQTVTRDLTLTGLGSVAGRVLNPEGRPAPGLQVSVRSTNPFVGGFFGATTNAEGEYVVPDVPVGAFTATAADHARGLQGETNGQVTQHGQTVVADIRLLDNAVSLPLYLYDANGFSFDVQGNGSIGYGTSLVYAGDYDSNTGGLLLDVISGGVSNRFAGGSIGTKENDGRQVAVRQENISGLNVTRKVYVPREGYFARYLEILSNPTDSPLTVDVRVQSNLGSYYNGAQQVYATSSGDAVPSVADAATADRWLVVDDGFDADPFLSNYSTPAAAFVYDGPNGAERAAGLDLAVTDTARRELSYRWNNVTVAPGATVALLHFGVQQTSRVAARAAAERLVQLPPEALAGLTHDEIAAVRNFAVPVAGTSTLSQLPSLRGTVTGRLLASDNATNIPGGQVQFKSNHVLFGRTHFTFADNAGSFNLAANFDDFGGALAIPVDGFTLSAQHPQTGAQSPNFTGTFAGGQTTATRDIIFSNTGIVRGVVRRHTGQPVAAGVVQLSIFHRFSYATVALGGDGSYSFNGVPAGNFTVTAYVGNQQGTALTGSTNFSVAAGQVATADISIPPTGVVTGIVRDAAGSPAAGSPVTLYNFSFTRQTTTDAAGRYTFDDAPVGSFTVEAREPRTGTPTTAQVTVAPDQTVERDLTFIGVGQVEVQVNNAVGSGVGFTPVYLRQARNGGYYFVGYTDAGGHLTVFNVPVGDFTVLAYNPNNFDLYADASGHVASDGGTASVLVQLPGTGVVNGRVTFPDGAPVTAAVVELTGYNVPTQVVGTDSAGNYSFGQVVVGREFTVRAHSPGDHSIYRDAAHKSLTRDGETLTLDLSLPAVARLRVTVLKSDGSAYADAQLNLRDLFRPYLRYVGNTDAGGVLLIPNVPEGDFSLQAYDPDTGAPRGSTVGTVNAADHGRTLDVTINAPRAGTVRGTVFAGDGQTPLKGLNVYVEAIDVATEQFLASTYTRLDTATYQIENVAPGALGFKVRASYYRFSGAGEAAGTIADDGDTVELNLAMPVSVIKGTVTFHDGAPVPYPSVYVTQPGAEGDNTFYSSGEDEQGHFTVYGPAVGDFVATTQSSEFGLTASVNGNVADISVPVVLNIALPPTGTVTGRVLRRGAVGSTVGVPSARVRMTTEGGSFQREADTDADGRYTFERVVPGPLTFEAEETNSPGLIGRATATLATTGETVVVNITLPDSGTVAGTVFRPDGTTPAAHASVVITSLSLSYERSTTADANGVYRFAGIPLGPFSLQAVDASQFPYVYGWRGGELADVGGQVAADITTLAARAVDGRVLRADGTPVAGAQVRVRGIAGSGPFGSFNNYVATDADGRYAVAGVPVGLVRVSAVDPVDYNVVGVAEATLTETSLSDLDVTLGNAFRWPFNLDGADGFRYDLSNNGEMNAGGTPDGASRSYFGAYYLVLNGVYFQPYFEEGTSEEGGRQARVGTFGMSGLYVTRKVFSPAGGGFARYLEVLTNPTDADITVQLRADHHLSSYDTTRVVVAPSATGNRYAVTDGGANAVNPALAFVFAGPGAAAVAARFTDESYYQTYSWSVTIPAGQTRALMHFAVQRAAADAAGAQAQAEALVNLTDPRALDHLSAAERSQVVNFQIP